MKKWEDSAKKPRKRRLLQPPREKKSAKLNRGSEVIQICTLSAERRRECPEIDLESPETLLSCLVYPETPKDFLDHTWNKRAYAVLNAPPRRVESLAKEHLFGLDVRQLIEATASPNVFAWMKQGSSNKISSIELSEDAAYTCYKCGASLYFRAPQDIGDALVAGISEGLKLGFAGRYPSGELRGEVETFVSRKGHVTDWHFDYMHNFTVQLRGTKRWRFCSTNSILNPIRGCTPHYDGVDNLEQQIKVHRLANPAFTSRMRTRMKNHETVTLTPGSAMYFPAGMWHKVECTEDSISINISLMPTSWSDVVSEGLRQMMWREKAWREAIHNLSYKQARSKLHGLLYNLKQLVRKLTVDDLLPQCLLSAERKVVYVRTMEGKNSASGKNDLDSKANTSNANANGHPANKANLGDPHYHDELNQLYRINIESETSFRFNHLAVMIKETDFRKKRAQDALKLKSHMSAGSLCSEESGDDTDDTKASMCALLNGSGKLTKQTSEVIAAAAAAAHPQPQQQQQQQEDGGVEMEVQGQVSSGSSGNSGGRRSSRQQQTVTYHLHINFGNEQLESAVEIHFVVSKKLELPMDLLTQRREESFTVRNLMSRLKEESMNAHYKHSHSRASVHMQHQQTPLVGELIHLLKYMVFYGYLIIEPSCNSDGAEPMTN
mmetsp:Transcript_8009/g.14842  ORF Transcript_8009/g.14842 Transcript_8009/m.14842 type:complete len:664 (+) Transcript_8009:169-2160(+)|eukprot:CAMPEP_0197530818 /NCGR_PEP_ID=MMETSP1318-20131121/33039_1 /TAXON_ID=552666 /ORGANISM="Partenskyella glossopodia, Strain RCC365" /LENGTH=663 /DNA_ID=CAMNT_0043086797 /DNA_START=98 /DNA_END=2089 /DNA_ORIENTATION=+